MKAFHFLKWNMTSDRGVEPAWEVGELRVLSGPVIPCSYGYHASPTLWDALDYASGTVACLVEIDDDSVPHGDPTVDKYVSTSRKLLGAVPVHRELRLFAADCAERSLYIYERNWPGSMAPREAIQTARNFANGVCRRSEVINAFSLCQVVCRNLYGAARYAALAALWAITSDITSDLYPRNTTIGAARQAADLSCLAIAWDNTPKSIAYHAREIKNVNQDGYDAAVKECKELFQQIEDYVIGAAI